MNVVRQHSLLLLMLVVFSKSLSAQIGCPGCIVSLPVLPNDTIYLSPAPNGEAGAYYSGDISFRLPKTTTPVNAQDPSTPAGLPISNIDIVAVVNVPPGLNWQASQLSFNPSNQTDGCVKFCGTPLQAGTFEVEVFVNATVLTLNQATSFKFPILIAPSTSTSNGFNLFNNSGCGSVTASFENNVPSNGQPGYTYTWDFGNGSTSSLENPPTVTYDQPGTYSINYTAVIDTFGFQLTTVRVLDASCDDILINTPPDLYLRIKDPLGNLILETNAQDNSSFPAAFNVNLMLGDGIYELEVRDEDTFGSESCGTIFFTKTTSNVVSGGDLEVQFDIIHPVQTIQSEGTVTVYPIPTAPVIQPNGNIDLCIGEEIELVADYDQNLQWFNDSTLLLGEIYQQILVSSNGQYWLEYTSPEGCKAQSERVEVSILPLPAPPAFNVTGNQFDLADPSLLPNDYSLQWYMDGNILPGETGPSYCLMEPGVFLMSLEVTDNATGCTNEFDLGVAYDPSYTCATSTIQLSPTANSLNVFPNPSDGRVTVSFEVLSGGSIVYQLYDGLGRMVFHETLDAGNNSVQHNIDITELTAGIYHLKIETPDGYMSAKLQKL